MAYVEGEYSGQAGHSHLRFWNDISGTWCVLAFVTALTSSRSCSRSRVQEATTVVSFPKGTFRFVLGDVPKRLISSGSSAGGVFIVSERRDILAVALLFR